MERVIVSILFFLVRVNILQTERFKLDINPIAPVYWIDSGRIFVNEEKRAFIYDIVKREILEEYERKENQLWGMCSEGVFVCGWSNKEISSPEEFSSRLIVDHRDGENILDVELKPTVEVVECGGEPLLKTIFPIEEKYFSFTDELYEVDSYDEDLLSPNFKRLLSRDSLGNYWVTEFKLFK
jgi:hypothetical protein